MSLRYIGQGSALPDVPARDLGDEELDDLAATAGPLLMGHGGRISFVNTLINSGLYTASHIATAEQAPAPPAESE
jgi:hypothetical protein